MPFSAPQFIGNRRIVDFFARVLDAGRIHSTYIFAGPPQIGKATLARLIAAHLLHIPLTALQASPDFIILERVVDEKTERRKKELSVEQARLLKTRVQQSAWGGGYKVVIIEDAETLSEEAGNALLKVLEEAPPRTVFFLLARHEEALLPTIRSRAETLRFTAVAAEELSKSLQEQGFAASDTSVAVIASFGRPGFALDYLTREDIRTAYTLEQQRFHNLFSAPLYRRSRDIEAWLGKGEDTPLERDELDRVLELWALWWRSTLVVEVAQGNAAAARASARLIRLIASARSDVRQNVNPRLVLENLVYAA